MKNSRSDRYTPMRIRMTWPHGTMTATLDDTPTARALGAVLPAESLAQTWGEEVYFELPLTAKLEPNARQVVDPGTVCFWVDGRSLALPFGATPISKSGECRLVTACNVLGRTDGDPRALASVKPGDRIRVDETE